MASPGTKNGEDPENVQKEEGETTKVQHNDEIQEPEQGAVGFNPEDDETSKEDLERIRGDAIGNTLYSERFVLSTLLKLKNLEKELADDEEFEKELCALWDMTIEEDVVELLLDYKVLDVFSSYIEMTEDKRLIEILVGIIGNMCSVQNTRSMLCNGDGDVMKVLLELTGCSDSPTLLQLMRLFAVIAMNAEEDSLELWYKHFCGTDGFLENLCFILANSVNEDLLHQTLETLNAILAKFAIIERDSEGNPDGEGKTKSLDFVELFVKETLVRSTVEAFKTLQGPLKSSTETYDEQALPNQKERKLIQTFVNIHNILVQYEQSSREAYEPVSSEILTCFELILKPLCSPLHLLPLSQYEQDVLELLNDLFLILNDPFDIDITANMITIWYLVAQESAKNPKSVSREDNFEDDSGNENHKNFEECEVNYEDFCSTILELIVRCVSKAGKDHLLQSLRLISAEHISELLRALSSDDKREEYVSCHSKMKDAFDDLNESS